MEDTNPQENTSGRGRVAVVPPEIRGWNWGAFFLNGIWGLGNSTYVALLMFVPFVNFVMPFVLGARGNEWAWRNRMWRDVEHFKKAQRNWARASLLLILILPGCFGVIMSSMRQTEAFQLSLSAVQRSEEAKAVLGEPIVAGLLVSGSVSTSGPDGTAAIQYSVRGPKAAGQAIVYATKHAGRWALQEIVVDVPNQKRFSVVSTE